MKISKDFNELKKLIKMIVWGREILMRILQVFVRKFQSITKHHVQQFSTDGPF